MSPCCQSAPPSPRGDYDHTVGGGLDQVRLKGCVLQLIEDREQGFFLLCGMEKRLDVKRLFE